MIMYTILFLGNFSFLETSISGGTERMTMIEMREFSNRGHKCLFIQYDNGNFYEQDYFPVNLKDYLLENKVDFVINQIGYSEIILRCFLELGGKEWQKAGGKIISCLHFSEKVPNLIASLKFRLRYLSFIGKSRALCNFVKILVIKFLRGKSNGKNFCVKNSDQYILLSGHYINDFVTNAGINCYEKISVISNPLPRDRIFREKDLLSKEKNVIVVARLEEIHKRISLCLEAWKNIIIKQEFSDWKLQIIGSGTDESIYREMVKRDGILNVEFIPFCNPVPYYEKGSIFVMTSAMEGWPLTLLEALQYGCVVTVMESEPVFREILGEAGCITADGDIRELIDALEELMRDATKRYQFAVKSIARATEFTLEKFGDKWEDLLNRLYVINKDE